MGYLDKIGKFNTFSITQERYNRIGTLAQRQAFRHFRNAFIFGALVELMVIKTSCFSNIIQSTTLRRLDSKKLEDDLLKERRLRLEDLKNK